MVGMDLYVRLTMQPLIKFVEAVADSETFFLDLRIHVLSLVQATGSECLRLKFTVLIRLQQSTTQSIVTCINLEYDWFP